MRISDWSSDVCSSDLAVLPGLARPAPGEADRLADLQREQLAELAAVRRHPGSDAVHADVGEAGKAAAFPDPGHDEAPGAPDHALPLLAGVHVLPHHGGA